MVRVGEELDVLRELALAMMGLVEPCDEWQVSHLISHDFIRSIR